MRDFFSGLCAKRPGDTQRADLGMVVATRKH